MVKFKIIFDQFERAWISTDFLKYYLKQLKSHGNKFTAFYIFIS